MMPVANAERYAPNLVLLAGQQHFGHCLCLHDVGPVNQCSTWAGVCERLTQASTQHCCFLLQKIMFTFHEAQVKRKLNAFVQC